MTDPERWARLIDLCLAGEASPAEREEFDRLFAMDQDFREQVLALHSWSRVEASVAPTQVNVDQALARVRRELTRPTPSAGRHLTPQRATPRYLRAAALIGGIGIAVWVGRDRLVRLVRPPAAPVELSAAPGRSLEAKLPDGTSVVIAPDSRLTYSSRYGGDRALTLVGEAYFAVRHDARRDFVINAGNATATDIGTHFVIRAYPTDSDVRIAVTEGVVSMRSDAKGRPILVRSGSLGIVHKSGAIDLGSSRELDALLAWRDGQLTFLQAPLADAVRDIARWYGITVRLADSTLGTVRVSGSLPSARIDDALNALATVAHATWTRQGQVVVFSTPPLHHRLPAAHETEKNARN